MSGWSMVKSHTAGNEILELVRRQVSLGPRYPGSAAHAALAQALYSGLQEHADRAFRQEFVLNLGGRKLDCANLVGVFEAQTPPPGKIPSSASELESPQALLLGSHFDTRLRADREEDPHQKNKPIPGANDGGSGTAVLYYLLKFLRITPLKRKVLVVFFDAEDVGDIDHHPFSVGARVFAENPPPSLQPPGEVIVLDMVGGRNMVLDVDAHILASPPSLKLTSALFEIGMRSGFQPFVHRKQGQLKHIICDHYPFLARGIPSCILIDLDYPEWHTQGDLPGAMSPDSLAMTAEVLKQFLLQFQV